MNRPPVSAKFPGVHADIPPLTGVPVLVTRPGKAGESLCDAIAARNGRPILLPTIAIEAVDPGSTLGAPARADLAIFVSRAAVDFGVVIMQRSMPEMPQTIIAVGEATATALARHGIAAVTPPAGASNSEGLLQLPQLQAEHIRQRRILVFRGQGGREHLAEGLRQRGAEVQYVEVYRRRPLVADIAAAVAAAGGQRPQVMVATSVEVLAALADSIHAQRQDWLSALPLVTLSERIAEEAARLGFTGPVWLARDPCEEAILDALTEWAECRHGTAR